MPSHHDYGIDAEHFCGGTPDDETPCPSCGSARCVNFACEDEGDLRFEMPPADCPPGRVFLCCICHKNSVDALNGFDTCSECLARQ